MRFLKNQSNKSYIKWNVESGSGFFSLANQFDNTLPTSGSGYDGSKSITISYFSVSNSSDNPAGNAIFQWENQIKNNPSIIETTEEEYNTFISTAYTDLQNNWPTV